MKRKLLAALFLPVLVISVFSLNGWQVVDAGISDCDLFYNSRSITEELRFDNNLQLYGYGADDEGTRILYIQSRDNGSNECDWPGGFFWLEKPAISANDEEYIFRSGSDARFYIEQGYEDGSAVYVANGGPSSGGTSVQVSSSERASAYFQSSNTPDPPSQDSGTIDAIENEGGIIDSDSTASDNEEEETCEDVTGGWSWAICGLLRLTANGLNAADGILESLLETPNEYIVNDAAREAWVNFRNLAYILLIPTLLIMVISTALGFEFVSAYTVKKALPRMIAATIFIAFSYEVTSFIIAAVNTIGFGIQGFLAGAAGQDTFNLASNFPAPGNGPISLGWIGIGAGAAVGMGWLWTGGFFVFVGFLGAAILAVLGVLLLLAFRQIAIMMLAIIAPLAIIAWIFPGNTKLWSLWRATFLKLLLLYPVIMLAIGGGKLFASVIADIDATTDVGGIANKLLILGAYIGPYFLIPKLFKTAGGAFANLAGMVNNSEKGLMDRSRNWGKGRKQTSASGQAREARKKEKIEARSRRANENRLARAKLREGDRSGAMEIKGAQMRQRFTRSGRKETREADTALLEAEVTKGSSAVRAGYGQKQASEIEIQAQTIRAQQLYESTQNDEISAGMAQGDQERVNNARATALRAVREGLIEDLNNQTATDAQVSGTMQFLGGQKSDSDLNGLQDAISGMSGEAKTRAAQQWQNAFGNSTTYGAVVGTSPGAKAPIAENPEAMRTARAESLAGEAASTIAGAKPGAIAEALRAGTQEQVDTIYNKLAEAYSSGGELRAGIKLDPNSLRDGPIYEEVVRRSASRP